MQIKYKIREFNETDKTVTVDFEDGSWAKIQLTLPFPKDKAALEIIIAQFAAPVEFFDAQNAGAEDISFIKNLVGKNNVTNRRRLSPEMVELPEQPSIIDIEQERLKQEELTRTKIKALIEQVLDERAQNAV